MAHEFQEVNEAIVSWIEVCFVQFLTAGVGDVSNGIEVAPDVALLVVVGVQRHRRIVTTECVVPGDVARLPRFGCAPGLSDENEGLNFKFRAPVAKKVVGPRARTPHERPSEGTITRALPNKNVLLINPREFEQVASKKPANMKFSRFSRLSRIDVDVGSFAKTKEGSDGEEAEWPGQEERRRVRTVFNQFAVDVASIPNKNVALTGDRADPQSVLDLARQVVRGAGVGARA